MNNKKKKKKKKTNVFNNYYHYIKGHKNELMKILELKNTFISQLKGKTRISEHVDRLTEIIQGFGGVAQ
jgi:hypothetical protein